MFIKNKYTKCYYNIIHRAQSRTLDSSIYVEKHHIIPRSLGGGNDNTNLIRLTGREHFICHLLLPKMTSGTDRKKMIYAIWMMCRAHRNRRSIYKVTARTYNSIKEVMRNNRTADDFTPEWKAKISVAKKGGKTWNKGRAVPEEQKARQSATRKSKNGILGFNTRPSCRPEKAKAISDSLTGKKWIYNPNTFVDRKYLDPDKCLPYLALGWIFGFGKRPSVVKKKCTHCNKLLDPGNYQLHHGDKCKLRQLPIQLPN
jgi:hypothetical protein